MRKTLTIITLSVLAFASSGCGKWLDVNDNPNYPTDVEKSSLLPTVEMRLAEKVGYDIAMVGSFWSQYIVQYSSSNQYYTIMTNNLRNSSSWFTSPWTVFYGQNLPSLHLIIKEYSGDKSKANFVFEAKSLLAYHLYLLTSLYGDVCYTDSFQSDTYRTVDVNSNPKFDSAKDIQGIIVKLLEDLRAQDFNEVKTAEATNSSAASDPVFSGDQKSWKQFVNTLYLKVLMRDFEANKTKIESVLAEDDLLESDMAFAAYEDKVDKSNPLYESDQRQLNTTKNIRACDDVIKNLDPSDGRVAAYYTMNPGGGYTGTAYGTTGSASTSQLNQSATMPVYFATADEAQFLKAEAYARLGNAGAAETAYNAAVNAAFARVKVEGASALLAGSYKFDSSASAEAQVEQIITQKWLSNVLCMPIESWFDLNRTGYPTRGTTITDYSGVLSKGAYPKRFMYSYYSQAYNTNAPKAVSIDEKLWWQK